VRLPRLVEPLRHRDFRLLWTGQTVSMLGNFVHAVALPFQILALGGAALELGLWGAIFSGTMLVFSLIGGAIVDRFPRRNVILASDLGSGGVVGVVALLSATGALRLEHLYVAAALFGAAASFFQPALNAIIPELVPAEVLQAGNAVRGTSRQIALLAGPVLGGLLVALAGLPFAFAVDAATFFISFGALWIARPPRHEPPPPAPLLRQVREGHAYTFSVPWLWIFIFAWALVLLGQVGPLGVAMPIFVRDVLRGDARLYGLLTAAIGVGEIATALVLAQVKVRRLGIAICVFAIIGGLSIAGIGLIRSSARRSSSRPGSASSSLAWASCGRPRCRSTCRASSWGVSSASTPSVARCCCPSRRSYSPRSWRRSDRLLRS
jgi:MFS family permease